MMPTSELNKERLQTIASWRAKYSAGHNVVLPAEEAEMMARSLIAVMEQEPFGYYSAEVPIILEQQSHANITREAMGEYQFPLYSCPLPVVSFYLDGIEAAAKWVDQQREAYDNEHGRNDPDTGSFEFGNDAQRDYSSTLVDIADGIRKLHPNAGNFPVIPDGWIKCSEQMPEDGDAVLVCQEGGVIFCAEVESGCFYPDEFPNVPKEGREITHWMSLPAAPQQEETCD